MNQDNNQSSASLLKLFIYVALGFVVVGLEFKTRSGYFENTTYGKLVAPINSVVKK